MKIKRDTTYGYGTYEWLESERRLEALASTWQYHEDRENGVLGLSFDYTITYDFEGGRKEA